MRARSLKPGLFANELLGTRDPVLTILFAGLWCLADREGRLEDRPLRIKAQVFPYRDVDIESSLAELHKLRFIDRYQAEKLCLIEVLNFKKHQSPHLKEKQSELPSREKSGAGLVLAREIPAPAHLTPDSGLLTPDSGLLSPDSKSSCSSFSNSNAANGGVDLENSESQTPKLAREAKKQKQLLSNEAEKLALLLLSEIQRNRPQFPTREAQLRQWAEVADRLLRLDGRTFAEVSDVIRFAQGDDFERANVLSMDKIRKRFDQLAMKREAANQPRKSCLDRAFAEFDRHTAEMGGGDAN